MRKIWMLSLFGLFAFCTNSTFAASDGEEEKPYYVVDGGQSRYVCSEQSYSIGMNPLNDPSITGGQNCSSQVSLYYMSVPYENFSGITYKIPVCTSCPSGYVMDTVTQTSTDVLDCVVTYQTCRKQNTCPADCPSQTEYTPDPSGNGIERICVKYQNEFNCVPQCQEGYYQTWKGRWNNNYSGSFRCQKCPENSVHCEAGTEGHSGEISAPMFECERNYYRVDKNSLTSPYVNYECRRCPSYASVPTVTSGTGATSVNRCYVPNSQHMRDAAGNEFRFESNCYYTGTYTPGGSVQIYPRPIN